jgi:hypothetical protein
LHVTDAVAVDEPLSLLAVNVTVPPLRAAYVT